MYSLYKTMSRLSYWLVLILGCIGLYAQHIGLPYAPQFLHYCLLSCYTETEQLPNVACYAAPCLPSYSCGEKHKRMPFNDTERQYIVDRHNEIRNAIALGNVTDGGNAASTDMHVMSYDKELEFLASCWSNQCFESPLPSHGRDDCRATMSFSENGQNHWSNASNKTDTDWDDIKNIEAAIMYWYNQRKYTRREVLLSFMPNRKENYVFFTQMAWSDTYLIGCGRTRFNANRYVGINIVCNYAPGGNILKEPVYMIGSPPCSRYTNMATNDKYPGLCGKERPLSEDEWVPPFELAAMKSVPCIFLLIVLEFIVLYVFP